MLGDEHTQSLATLASPGLSGHRIARAKLSFRKAK